MDHDEFAGFSITPRVCRGCGAHLTIYLRDGQGRIFARCPNAYEQGFIVNLPPTAERVTQ